MKRAIRVIVIAVNMLLLAAVGWAWLRSLSRPDVLVLGATAPPRYAVFSYHNRITFIDEPALFGGPFWPFADWDFVIEKRTWMIRTSLPKRAAEFLQTFCTSDAEYHLLFVDVNAKRSYLFSVPYWELSLISATPMLVLLYRKLRRHNLGRRAANLCPTCGYDLRASPMQCPECGTPAANSSEAKHA